MNSPRGSSPDPIEHLDFTLDLKYDVFKAEDGFWVLCCLSCNLYREYLSRDLALKGKKAHSWSHWFEE